MPVGRRTGTKLRNTTCGADVQAELKKLKYSVVPQEVMMGANTLLGPNRKLDGILTAEEIAMIPKKNRTGSQIRVPASVLKSLSERSLKEGTRVALTQSARTRRRITDIAEAHALASQGRHSDLPDSGSDFIPPFDDYCEVPVSDLFFAGQSHGDDEAPAHSTDMRYNHIIETMQGPAVVRRRHRRNQTRAEKKKSKQRKWDSQEKVLADSLMQWFHTNGSDIDAPPAPPAVNSDYFTIETVVGLQWCRRNWPIPNVHIAYPGESLIAAGLLSNAPDTPSWAVSIRTLETYRLLRLNKPNLSIQAFVRTMCMAHQRTSTTSLQEKFSDVFDLYLQLRRNIETRLRVVMGRNAATWHTQHFCPACTHTVPGEESLKHQFAYSIDGGNSAKRWAGAGAASEGHAFTGDHQIRLSESDVDVFKGVVKRRKAVKKKKGKGNKRGLPDGDTDDEGDDTASDCSVHNPGLELDNATTEMVEDEEYIVKNIQGDPTAEGDPNGDCVKNWKANADDSKKGMFDCFDESGVFIAICKHGLLILYCDMIRSGELAKYPIAITKHIEDLFRDIDKIEGYDIWCEFVKTLAKAGIVIKGEGTTLSMHGYGHNRLCQLQYHPIYRPHAGLADFEQCERFFSGFNALASVTRHSSTFHRHQWIEMYCRQSNMDKLANIGTYIFNNYRQALDIIKEFAPGVATLQRNLGLSNADIERMGKDEAAYIEGLKRAESEEDSLKCLYLESLQKYWEAEAIEQDCLSRRTGNAAALNSRNKGKRSSKKSIAAILADTELFLERVNDLEAKLDISRRWTKTSPEYVAALTYCNERAYHKAANHLRAQVIQRLMELAKCHMPNTNYSVRVNINKHLQTRSKTIQSSLRSFNSAARKLRKPTFSSKKVLEDTFLDNFYILCDIRSDTRNLAWANADNRHLRDRYYKVQCAKYEIKILNVEIGRMFAWMDSETKAYDDVIKQLAGDPALASWATHDRTDLKRRCSVIRHWLNKCQQLDDYSGSFHRVPPDPTPQFGDDPEDNEDDDVLFQAVDELDRVLGNMDKLG